MGVITLKGRQRLSQRVQSFGGTNGRGYRFGDVDSDRYFAIAEAGAKSGASSDEQYEARNAVDWNAMYKVDYARTYKLDTIIHGGQARWAPPEGPKIPTPVIPRTSDQINDTTPVIPTPVIPTPVIPPPVFPNVSTTNAEYQDAIVSMQIEAARLAAVASANQATMRAESRRIAAEDALARQKAAAEEAASVHSSQESEHKPNTVPWLIAAGIAFLVLKG